MILRGSISAILSFHTHSAELLLVSWYATIRFACRHSSVRHALCRSTALLLARRSRPSFRYRTFHPAAALPYRQSLRLQSRRTLSPRRRPPPRLGLRGLSAHHATRRATLAPALRHLASRLPVFLLACAGHRGCPYRFD